MNEQRNPTTRHDAMLVSDATYRVITDTVIGPNLRVNDNLYQGLAITMCTILGAVGGYYLASASLLGGWLAAGLGGVVGAAIGVLLSGTFLMFYRGVRHALGRHD